jgi:hypothetical protein
MNARDLIFRNFWLKLFSVVSGTVIWMAIHYSITHDVALEEPAPGVGLIKRDIMVPVIVMAQNRESILESISNLGTNRTYDISPFRRRPHRLRPSRRPQRQGRRKN